jgi:hypothetical protein
MDCRFSIADFRFELEANSIGDRKSEIENVQRRQSAVRAHNALTAYLPKSGCFFVKFFGSNASALNTLPT